MRRMRGVGAVAGAAVALVLVAGCGADGGDADAKTSTGTPSAGPVEAATLTADPSEEAFPDTPAGRLDREAAGRLDREAAEEGWEVDSLYPAASDYVDDICESMSNQRGFGRDPGEWLMTAQTPSGDEEAVLRAGMPTLCKKWWPATKKALGGDFVHTYGDGDYEVKARPADFESEIAPGTYRTTGDLDGCYWERSTRAGNIIANNFASAAREITVTVRATDGLFKTENCGTWKPVG
ncbi:hypothetical protein [Streptomyces sp. NPDC093589]|uniref:hypothetical protein n=1 Tax=Streptomyces sp. NPDC093589 TaxID=3366043 RepID=UPI003815F729